MAISPESKMNTPDRTLILAAMEGKKPLDSLGNSDKRLFTGENKLHAIMDQQSTLWHLKYEMGDVPQLLKGQFTSYKMLKQHADNYYRARNIEINEVR